MAGIKNTSKDKIHLNSFISGSSLDYKYATANSFYSSQAMDFRQRASQMSVLPGLRQSSGTLKDLITAMVQDPNGVRYGVGNAGNIYRIKTDGTISQIALLSSNGSAGIAYNQQSDQLYIPSQNTVSLYGQVQGTPSFRMDQFGPSASTAPGMIYTFDATTLSYDGANNTTRNNLNSLAGTGLTPSNYTQYVTNTLTNTYVLPSTIIEDNADMGTFVPDITPIYSFALYVTKVGTGNLTLTLHDSLNNSLGSVTVAYANITLGWNNFVLNGNTGVDVIPNAFATGAAGAYHFHLTSSVVGDTAAVASINSQDISGANMVMFAQRLLTTHNGWHPTTIFAGLLCVGNGRYLSTYNFGNDAAPNNQQWIRHQLTLDFGYEVCGLTTTNQYLVIAAEKRSNNANKNYQDGMLYFWDGSNQVPNFKIEIPMGAPYSVFAQNNVVYFIVAGSLFAWGGGTQVIKVRYISYQNTDYLGTVDNTIVNPNMMDSRYNLLMIGFPSITTNVNIGYGIYSWGSVELTYPNSFGYSYAPSIAASQGIQSYTSQNNFQLGMIKNFVDQMYMSWQYTDTNSVTHYGIDILDNSSTPAPVFNWQSLIWDGGVRYKTKRALRYRINFLPLPAGCTLTANYTIDRGNQVSTDLITGVSYSASTGDTAITIDLYATRFKELQWGFSGTSSASAVGPVTITGVTMEIDPLEDEVGLRQDVHG